MPKIHINIKRKQPIAVRTITVRELAERTCRKLDEAARSREAIRKGAKLSNDRKLTELALVGKDGEPVAAAIHHVTNNACWRPDLYLDAGRYCDNCGLYKYCKATSKRLKSKSSQDADENETLEKAALRREHEEGHEEFAATVIASEDDDEDVAQPAPAAKPVKLKVKPVLRPRKTMLRLRPSK